VRVRDHDTAHDPVHGGIGEREGLGLAVQDGEPVSPGFLRLGEVRLDPGRLAPIAPQGDQVAPGPAPDIHDPGSGREVGEREVRAEEAGDGVSPVLHRSTPPSPAPSRRPTATPKETTAANTPDHHGRIRLARSAAPAIEPARRTDVYSTARVSASRSRLGAPPAPAVPPWGAPFHPSS